MLLTVPIAQWVPYSATDSLLATVLILTSAIVTGDGLLLLSRTRLQVEGLPRLLLVFWVGAFVLYWAVAVFYTHGQTLAWIVWPVLWAFRQKCAPPVAVHSESRRYIWQQITRKQGLLALGLAIGGWAVAWFYCRPSVAVHELFSDHNYYWKIIYFGLAQGQEQFFLESSVLNALPGLTFYRYFELWLTLLFSNVTGLSVPHVWVGGLIPAFIVILVWALAHSILHHARSANWVLAAMAIVLLLFSSFQIGALGFKLMPSYSGSSLFNSLKLVILAALWLSVLPWVSSWQWGTLLMLFSVVVNPAYLLFLPLWLLFFHGLASWRALRARQLGAIPVAVWGGLLVGLLAASVVLLFQSPHMVDALAVRRHEPIQSHLHILQAGILNASKIWLSTIVSILPFCVVVLLVLWSRCTNKLAVWRPFLYFLLPFFALLAPFVAIADGFVQDMSQLIKLAQVPLALFVLTWLIGFAAQPVVPRWLRVTAVGLVAVWLVNHLAVLQYQRAYRATFVETPIVQMPTALAYLLATHPSSAAPLWVGMVLRPTPVNNPANESFHSNGAVMSEHLLHAQWFCYPVGTVVLNFPDLVLSDPRVQAAQQAYVDHLAPFSLWCRERGYQATLDSVNFDAFMRTLSLRYIFVQAGQRLPDVIEPYVLKALPPDPEGRLYILQPRPIAP